MAQLSIEEMARRGGLRTLSKYGRDHFRKIGRKGGQRTKELYWNRFAEWGARGGRPPRQSLKEIMEGEGQHKKGGQRGPAFGLSPSATIIEKKPQKGNPRILSKEGN